MARKKKDPQLTENPPVENHQATEKKKRSTKNKSDQEIVPEEKAQPLAENAEATEAAQTGKPVKKRPQKIKNNDEPGAALTHSETTENGEYEKPVKKPKRRSNLKKEITGEEAVQEPVTFTEAADEVIEHIEPVTVAEEKNEAFVHKLVHSAEEHIHREEHNDLITEHSEPVLEYTEPVAEHIELVAKDTEPIEEDNEPVAEDIELIAEQTQPEETEQNDSIIEYSQDDSIQSEPVAEQSAPVEQKAVANDEIKITFIINYYTKPGQSLFITAPHPLFGGGNAEAALPLQFLDEQHWKTDVFVKADELTEDVVYKYLLKEEDGSFVYEGGKEKKISPSLLNSKNITFIDAWDFEGYYDNAFFTEPFKNVLLKTDFAIAETEEPATFTHLFKIKAPLLKQGEVVCLTGSCGPLTNWSTSEPLLLNKRKSEDWWQMKVSLSKTDVPLSYKYGIYDRQKKEIVQLENGDNRMLAEAFEVDSQTVVTDGFIRTPDNTWKGAGVAIPVFSLRSQNSWGCGEFTDIKKLVDWSKSVGIKLIQLLPVNDTTSTKTWRDSYPYAAISAFALHAMYLNTGVMVRDENKHLLDEYLEEAKRLNEQPVVDYEAVNDLKWKLIHHVYPLQSEATFASEDYIQFFNDNKHWLHPYAAFCCLRDAFNTADFSKWINYKTYGAETVEKFLSSDEQTSRAGMYYFVQYHLHLQLKDAAEYAHSNGIVIKGDIPIGISRNSADAWQQPQLFNMDMQAGAPPDSFAVKGQNWGFPTYNWPKMKEDGFAWWKQRFSQMSNYFDAFRIDHILGFFRIWSIPADAVEGIMGHFVPALPVHINEFQEWNIYFNYNRYCKPFMNDGVLNDLFGDQQQYVKDTFLNYNEGAYTLKPEVSTQKRVETYFAIREANPHNNWLKETLFDVISNVILFEEQNSGGQLFHFRLGMEKTLSYRYLDDYTKKQLYYLSINYFYERQNEFWRHEALQKLPALKQETDMLICGEDLGMVPSSVPRVMQDLGLLSLEVQRMPKDEKATFNNLEKAPYLSVVTPSTHDMSTIRGWWEEDRNITQNFYNNLLGRWGEAPQHCEPWINKQIVEQHLYSPAMWSIFQLQDLLGTDGDLRRQNPNEERINVPAIPTYYWQYRMHITLEQLINANHFNDELKETISASGR